MRKYWALAPTDQIATEVTGKWRNYHAWLETCGLRQVIQTCYDAYYSFYDGGFGVVKSVDGTTAKVKAQHFKSLIGRIKSLTTQAKLSYSPKAINSNSSTMLAVDLARSLCDYYADDPTRNMTGVVGDMVERGLVMLDSFVYAPWDFELGEAIRPGMNGKDIYEGDQVFKVLSRLDVASHRTLNPSPWHIVREVCNAFDMAEKYPEFAEDILASTYRSHSKEYIRNPLAGQFQEIHDDDDLVEVYTLFHRKTKAMSSGRISVIIGTKCVHDSELYYETYPIVHFRAAKIMDANMGDSPATSLISLQEVIDALYSSVSTNNLQCSRQSIWSPSPINVEALSDGYTNVISAQKPEALQLTASSGEAYKLIDKLESVQQILSGVNATARGNPEANLKSGNSLALMLSVAVQFADEFQKEYARCAGELASILISNLRQFAKDERLVTIGGMMKKAEVVPFRGSQVQDIRSVTCDLGNPITQNIAGRYELVNQWTQYGLITDPKKLVEFLRTGQIDSLIEDEFKDVTLTRSENEMLRNGKTPEVMVTDNHPGHIRSHKSVVDDPEVRSNPAIVQATTDHIMAHIEQMLNMPPELAALLGLPAVNGQAPGVDAGTGEAQPGAEQNTAGADQTGIASQSDMPNLPKLPKTPEGTPEEFGG